METQMPDCVFNDFGSMDEIAEQRLAPEVIVYDFQNAGLNLKSLKEVNAIFPDVKLLVIGNGFSVNDFKQFIDLGVKGSISESADLAEFKKAVEDVSIGKIVFPHDILQSIMLNSKQVSGKQSVILTDREIEILRLLCDELSNEEISEKLHLSYDTVKWHRSNILAKCECKNILSLYKYAVRHKLVQVSKSVK